jgi:hypothetical protein
LFELLSQICFAPLEDGAFGRSHTDDVKHDPAIALLLSAGFALAVLITLSFVMG